MNGPKVSSLQAITIMIMWMRVILYTTPFGDLGCYVLIVVEIMGQIKQFLLLLMLVRKLCAAVVFVMDHSTALPHTSS